MTKVGPPKSVAALIDNEERKQEEISAQNAAKAVSAFPQLVEKANLMINLSDEIDRLEDQLKDLKAQRDHLRKSEIPDLMRKAGIVDSKGKGSFTVPGRKIYLETRVNASVTESNRPAFFEWLRQHHFGDLVKETVHPSTLTAFVKDRRSDGKEIPPTVSVFEETVAKSVKA